MRYFANCDYLKGKFRWYIGDKVAGGVICTSTDHSNLVRSLKVFMKKKNICSLQFEWENDGSTQTVVL